MGCGLGFGLKAVLDHGELDGSSGRADGVAVYLKRGATLVLAEVLGNYKVFGEGNESWEKRVAVICKRPQTSSALSSPVRPNMSGSGSPIKTSPSKPFSSPRDVYTFKSQQPATPTNKRT